jgi:hypothetical protein
LHRDVILTSYFFKIHFNFSSHVPSGPSYPPVSRTKGYYPVGQINTSTWQRRWKWLVTY